jgi:hypothetical protein
VYALPQSSLHSFMLSPFSYSYTDLGRPFPSDPTKQMFPPSHLMTETDTLSEMLCSLDLRIPEDGTSPKTQ